MKRTPSNLTMLILGLATITAGAAVVSYRGADTFRVGTTVAGIVSIAVTAWRPPADDSARWAGFLRCVAILVIAAVGAFVILPHFSGHLKIGRFVEGSGDSFADKWMQGSSEKKRANFSGAIPINSRNKSGSNRRKKGSGN